MPLAAALLVSGCSTWHTRPTGIVAESLPPRQQFQVWSGGRAQVVHAVRLVGDTLIAVPHFRAPDCDSCALRIPLAAVDSVRTKQYSPERTQRSGRIGMVLILTGLAAVAIFALGQITGFPIM